ICHPSMANNELSGPLVTAFLYRALAQLSRRRYTYRFVLAPETIGAIAVLHRYGEHLIKHCRGGFVITCVGDEQAITYKKSRRGDSETDRVTLQVLKHWSSPAKILSFFPSGSDERQYCSPGFNLPIGSLMRTMYGEYPQYHTSLDDKTVVTT